MAGTVNKELTLVTTILNRACKDWDWLPRVPRIRHVKGPTRTNYPLTWEEQGRLFATWADNVVVKIPVINEYGEPSLDVVRTLVDESIKVNMTACLSFGQVVLGAKAGATFISIFGGRVSDEGHDASEVIRNSDSGSVDRRGR